MACAPSSVKADSAGATSAEQPQPCPDCSRLCPGAIETRRLETRDGPIELTSRLLLTVHDAIGREQPDMVLAQGDTTTVLATALASFYHKVPFGHVEAGLRTGRFYAPFPDEANRILAGHLSALHVPPTASARDYLLREGIETSRIVVTGSTMINALLLAAGRDVPIGIELDRTKCLVFAASQGRGMTVGRNRTARFRSGTSFGMKSRLEPGDQIPHLTPPR
jgi:UDP-N-acetylglucosamine 2-epimerase